MRMRTPRTIILNYTVGVLLPVAVAVGAAWLVWGQRAVTPRGSAAPPIGPMVQSVVKATVGNYARLANEIGYLDHATLDGLIGSSAEIDFLQVHDVRRKITARAARGDQQPVRLKRIWTVEQAAFGFHAVDRPVVVAPMTGGGWLMVGLDLDAVKAAWGLPRSLAFEPVEPQDEAHQIVGLGGIALPGEGPWRSSVRTVTADTDAPAFDRIAIGLGLLVAFVGFLSAMLMARGVRRRIDGLRAQIDDAWNGASSRLPTDTRDLGVLARSIAGELRDLRDREDELSTEVIRLEHTEKDLGQRLSDAQRLANRWKGEAEESSRALVKARDDMRALEKKLENQRLPEGDTWFAAVVRDAVAHRDTQADPRQLLDRVAGLADQARRGMRGSVQVVNLGSRVQARLDACDASKALRVLVSPFATHVFANEHAVELLIDRLITTIRNNAVGEMTLRVWRHRSHQGTEMVRLALERTGAAADVDIVYHGLAALAGATVQAESFGDDRSAIVLYFQAAKMGADGKAQARTIDREQLFARDRELDERFAPKAPGEEASDATASESESDASDDEAAATDDDAIDADAEPTGASAPRALQLGSGYSDAEVGRRTPASVD